MVKQKTICLLFVTGVIAKRFNNLQVARCGAELVLVNYLLSTTDMLVFSKSQVKGQAKVLQGGEVESEKIRCSVSLTE